MVGLLRCMVWCSFFIVFGVVVWLSRMVVVLFGSMLVVKKIVKEMMSSVIMLRISCFLIMVGILEFMRDF